MSFGESIFSTGFIQKTVKVDLHVRINLAYLPRNGHQKVLEDTRGPHVEAKGQRLPSEARRPHLQVAQPQGPPISLHVVMSILHRLLGYIYAVL